MTASRSSRTLDYRDFILAELKCAALRSRLVTTEIDSIDAALRGDFISTDDAIAWLHECGAMQFVAVRESYEQEATA